MDSLDVILAGEVLTRKKIVLNLFLHMFTIHHKKNHLSVLYLGILVRKQGNEEFSDEEFLVRKKGGKNEEKLAFLGKN